MKYSVLKCTSSDWYPSYEINGYYKGNDGQRLIEVIFTPLSLGKWRVCAWGGDDCGVEKDFQNEKEAWDCYIEVIGLLDVTKEELELRGFISA